MQLTSRTYRLALNQASTDRLTDKLSNRPIAIPRGNGAKFQCAIFLSDPRETSLINDLGNIQSVTYVIRETNALGALLLAGTIEAEALNGALTFEEWEDATAQHFTIALSAAQTNIAPAANKTEKEIYIAFEAQTTTTPVLLGSGTGTIFEDGIGTAGDPPASDPTYWNAEESDARYVQRGVTGPDWRSDLDSLTGGTETALDSIPTEDLAAGYWIALVVTGEGLKNFVLREGTAAEASPGIIRPDDYAESTNEKYWESM